MKLLKFVPFMALLVVGLWLAPEAEAARARNRNTGWRSTNRAVVRETKVFNENVLKIGGVSNIDIIGENTGGNVVDENTGGDNNADSGEATATVATTDFVNYSTLDVTQSDSDPEDSAINRNTGARSANVARVENTRRASYREVSIGGVTNFSLIDVNTGDNSASKNTGGSNTVDSGDASVEVSHNSDVNSSEVVIIQ